MPLYLEAQVLCRRSKANANRGKNVVQILERLPYSKASLLRARKTMDDIYLVVRQLGEPIPELNFMPGTAFRERYCTVFDTAGRDVGFAKTPFTDADTN